jgi:anti-anti-sigma factor
LPPHDHPVIVDVGPSPASEIGPRAVVLDRVQALLDQRCQYILLNVAQLTYVDSVLLGAIVQAYASAIRRGGTLKLLHVTNRFRDLLVLTKLDRLIETVESDEPA